MSPNEPMPSVPSGLPGMSREDMLRMLSAGGMPGGSRLANAMGANPEGMPPEMQQGMPAGMQPMMSGMDEASEGESQAGMDPETLALIEQLLRSQNSPLGQAISGCGPQMMAR